MNNTLETFLKENISFDDGIHGKHKNKIEKNICLLNFLKNLSHEINNYLLFIKKNDFSNIHIDKTIVKNFIGKINCFKKQSSFYSLLNDTFTLDVYGDLEVSIMKIDVVLWIIEIQLELIIHLSNLTNIPYDEHVSIKNYSFSSYMNLENIRETKIMFMSVNEIYFVFKELIMFTNTSELSKKIIVDNIYEMEECMKLFSYRFAYLLSYSCDKSTLDSDEHVKKIRSDLIVSNNRLGWDLYHLFHFFMNEIHVLKHNYDKINLINNMNNNMNMNNKFKEWLVDNMKKTDREDTIIKLQDYIIENDTSIVEKELFKGKFPLKKIDIPSVYVFFRGYNSIKEFKTDTVEDIFKDKDYSNIAYMFAIDYMMAQLFKFDIKQKIICTDFNEKCNYPRIYRSFLKSKYIINMQVSEEYKSFSTFHEAFYFWIVLVHEKYFTIVRDFIDTNRILEIIKKF